MSRYALVYWATSSTSSWRARILTPLASKAWHTERWWLLQHLWYLQEHYQTRLDPCQISIAMFGCSETQQCRGVTGCHPSWVASSCCSLRDLFALSRLFRPITMLTALSWKIWLRRWAFCSKSMYSAVATKILPVLILLMQKSSWDSTPTAHEIRCFLMGKMGQPSWDSWLMSRRSWVRDHENWRFLSQGHEKVIVTLMTSRGDFLCLQTIWLSVLARYQYPASISISFYSYYTMPSSRLKLRVLGVVNIAFSNYVDLCLFMKSMNALFTLSRAHSHWMLWTPG